MTKMNVRKQVVRVLFFCAMVAIASQSQTLTTLVNLDGSDGAVPQGSLVQASNGSFYGTASHGGRFCSPLGCGTIFRMTAGGDVTWLHSFDGHNGDDVNGLLVEANGLFYGTALQGGGSSSCENGCGTIFALKAPHVVTLYTFCSKAGCPDSVYPRGLVLAKDGNFYGTTCYLAGPDQGTLFRITPSGTLTTLHRFCSEPGCADGDCPGVLIQASDGNLYGTTAFSGTNGYGTVFKITTAGKLTTLHSFNYNDGFAPLAALIQGSDRNFYGTTSQGGAFGEGEIFKMTPAGLLKVLYSFCSQPGCADGYQPLSGALVQAADGYLYGMTYSNGAFGPNYGTVFKLSRAGHLTTLHSFNGTDGAGPEGGLIQATNGTLYGTTSAGGLYGLGTIFSLDPN